MPSPGWAPPGARIWRDANWVDAVPRLRRPRAPLATTASFPSSPVRTVRILSVSLVSTARSTMPRMTVRSFAISYVSPKKPRAKTVMPSLPRPLPRCPGAAGTAGKTPDRRWRKTVPKVRPSHCLLSPLAWTAGQQVCVGSCGAAGNSFPARRIGGGRKLASKSFRRFTAHHNQSCGYHSSYPASLSHRAARPCGSPSDCSCSGGVNPPCAEVLPSGKTLTRRIGGGRKLASKPFRRFTAHRNQNCGYSSDCPASFL